MKKLLQIVLMSVFAAFCSCSSETEEAAIYRIYLSPDSESFLGSTSSDAYSVYNSIRFGLIEFEKKYCEEWTDVVKDGDFSAADKSAKQKYETVENYFKNFEIMYNDKIDNLPTVGNGAFSFAGKLVITRSSSGESNGQILNSYNYSFVYTNKK